MDAAQKFDYVPNKMARSLKLDKTETIGLVIPDISNPFFADIAKSIEGAARKKGYSIILCDSSDDIKNEEQMLKLLQGQKVDGIIIAPVGTHADHLIQVYESKLPVVVIDRFFPDSKLPYVTSDNFQGAYDAVNYLINQDHRRIACIQGIHESQPNIERVEGYKKALKDNNIVFDENLLVGNGFSKENGLAQTKLLFNLDNPPSAIFALSNLISLGVLEAASVENKHIPDDVSLISFDEQPYSAHLGTPMTTIDQQKNEMGFHSVDYLIKMIENQHSENQLCIRLPTKLIKRDSIRKLSEG